MKLATFSLKNGSDKPLIGLVQDDKILDLTGLLPAQAQSMKALLASDAGTAQINGLDLGSAPSHGLDEVQLLPPVANPDKVICVGLNYQMHVEETGRSKEEFPVLFTRFANSQIGHGEALWAPAVSERFDYEGELAVIIGKGGRDIAEADALSHIAGYSCYNDGSVRDWQFHTHQYTPGKNFLHTGAFGPWMVTADEIADPTKLELTTRLNGEVMQNATIDMMIFPIPHLIKYISTFTALEPGDVIVTGTPGGVGAKRNPPVFMKAGDVAEVEISNIGILKNPVTAAQ